MDAYPRPMVIAHPGAEALAAELVPLLGADHGAVVMHVFPDGESCPRLQVEVAGRDIVLVATLDRPDPKILPLYLLAMALREQQARRVLLVVPYLPYMRQDQPFRPGEGTSARHFAALLSSCVDGLVTVDPHLHRIPRLEDLYAVPSRTVTAASAIAAWIHRTVANPVLVGPDEESAQWVSRIAKAIGAPWSVLRKIRHGDREVEVSLPEANQWPGRSPVVVDDILSTGRTMIAAVRQLRKFDLAPAQCVGVHALFVEDAFEALQASGAARIVSCNTIAHPSNAIDIVPLVAEAVRSLLPVIAP